MMGETMTLETGKLDCNDDTSEASVTLLSDGSPDCTSCAVAEREVSDDETSDAP